MSSISLVLSEQTRTRQGSQVAGCLRKGAKGPALTLGLSYEVTIRAFPIQGSIAESVADLEGG